MHARWILAALLVTACSSAPASVHAPPAALAARQVLSLERGESPSDVVRAACVASAFDVVESVGSDEAGRVAAIGAAGAQVQASWEVATSDEGESWLLLVSGSDRDVLRQFVAALHAARASG